jgi:hypothetical protein
MMEVKMNSDDARVLLQSTQRLRTLWAGAIISYFVYTIALNAAIWTYFLKGYVESLTTAPGYGFSYLAVAAGLSSVILGLWRVFTRHMNDRIAGLYPDLLICEQRLGVEYEHGTAGYLVRTIPRLHRIFTGRELSPKQQGDAISFLVKKKSMGRLSHIVTDIVVLATIICMFVICVSMYPRIHLSVAIGSVIATILGFLLLIFGLLSFQRYPSQASVTAAIDKYNEEG